MFFRAFKEAQGDESKIKTFNFYGALQSSFFAEVGPQGQRQLAAKYTREGEGQENEGWQIHPEVVWHKLVHFLMTYFLRLF